MVYSVSIIGPMGRKKLIETKSKATACIVYQTEVKTKWLKKFCLRKYEEVKTIILLNSLRQQNCINQGHSFEYRPNKNLNSLKR